MALPRCSVVWLTRLLWEQEIARSSRAISTGGGSGRHARTMHGLCAPWGTLTVEDSRSCGPGAVRTPGTAVQAGHGRVERGSRCERTCAPTRAQESGVAGNERLARRRDTE